MPKQCPSLCGEQVLTFFLLDPHPLSQPLLHIHTHPPTDKVDMVLSWAHCSMVDQSLMHVLMPQFKAKGLGVINASPLSMGLLTPKVRECVRLHSCVCSLPFAVTRSEGWAATMFSDPAASPGIDSTHLVLRAGMLSMSTGWQTKCYPARTPCVKRCFFCAPQNGAFLLLHFRCCLLDSHLIYSRG